MTKPAATKSNLCRRICAILGAVAFLPAAVAQAVVVDLKDGSSIAGYLVSRDRSRVIVKLRRDAPETDWKRYPAADVVAVRSYVDSRRLERLHPSRPADYRAYAEELLEKRKDPEARDAAVRLFLIAARLDPARFGRPALVAVQSIADTPDERSRAGLLAWLLDPRHDPALLADSPATGRHAAGTAAAEASNRSDPANRRYAESLAAFRAGRLRDAAEAAGRPGVAELFNRRGPFDYDGFVARLVEPECRLCAKGYVTCRSCRGRGCTICGGTGLATGCTRCSGENAGGEAPRSRPALSDAELAAIVARELAALGGGAAANSGDDGRSWSTIVAADGGRPIRPLSLETLTDFDPRKSVFRDGVWTEP